MLTPDQFDALQSWMVAEIRAGFVRNSSGPHVGPAQDAANLLSLVARYHLTGKLSDQARLTLASKGYSL